MLGDTCIFCSVHAFVDGSTPNVSFLYRFHSLVQALHVFANRSSLNAIALTLHS